MSAILLDDTGSAKCNVISVPEHRDASLTTPRDNRYPPTEQSIYRIVAGAFETAFEMNRPSSAGN